MAQTPLADTQHLSVHLENGAIKALWFAMPVTFDVLARLALAPILLAQAAWVVMTAPRFPEADGPRSGAAGGGPPLNVLILGDSSAAGVGVALQDQALAGHVVRALANDASVSWRVIAQNGATTAQTLSKLRSTPPQPVDLAVVALGVNDVKNAVPLRRWARNYSALIQYLRQELGASLVIASGLPPIHRFPLLPQPLRWVLGRRAVTFDAALGDLASRRSGVAHLRLDFPLGPKDMAADGFHPGPAIYAAWAARVQEIARDRLTSGPSSAVGP